MVITRWYATDSDKQTHGPYETEKEAYRAVTLTEPEQLAQNRVHQKHAYVWKETVAVADNAGEHTMYSPGPPKALYYARIPDPSKLLPYCTGYSEVSREDAVRLLKKIVTWNDTRPFPKDAPIEVHTYQWNKGAMIVLPAEEDTE